MWPPQAAASSAIARPGRFRRAPSGDLVDFLGGHGVRHDGDRNVQAPQELAGYRRNQRAGAPVAGGGAQDQDGDIGLLIAQGQQLVPEIGKNTPELPPLMRLSYAVLCLKKKKSPNNQN